MPTIRVILAAVLIALLMLANTPPVRAEWRPPCNSNGSAHVGLQGNEGDTFEVFLNGQKVGAIKLVKAPGWDKAKGSLEVKGNGEIKVVDAKGNVVALGTANCPPASNAPATSNNTPNACRVGEPISTSIGEFSFTRPLLDLGGVIPLRFALTYAASRDKQPFAATDPFPGGGFDHTQHITLKWYALTAIAYLGDGSQVRFEKRMHDSEWHLVEEESGYRLYGNAAGLTKGYVLLDPIFERVYTFGELPWTLDYEAPLAFVTRIEDRNGNALVFTNDANGRVTRVEDGLGRALAFTYAEGKLAQVSDQTGRAIKFGYANNRLASVTDALGGTTKFAYAANAPAIASATLPRSNTPHTQTYAGAILQVNEPKFERPEVRWMEGADSSTVPIWRAETQTDALGNATRLKFDNQGVTTITDPLGNTTQHTHQDNRLLTQWKDAAGKTKTFGYDDAGRLTTITDRMGNTTRFTYHAPSGKLASITNARGETITYTYAPQEQTFALPNGDKVNLTFYNLTRVNYPDQSSEQYTYDVKGNVIARVDRAGQTWKYTYTPRGQVLTMTNPAGGVVTYTYNADATLASAQDAETGETKYGYDALKRLTKITYADGATVQIGYDANDQITVLTDENGRVTKFEYDANGNIVKMIDAAGKESAYAYDVLDRLSKITDRTGQVSTFSRDALGRITATTDATGVATQFAYDPRGWLNQITRADAAWKIGYDDEGVIAALTTPLGNITKFQRDKLGLLVGTTDALGNSSTLTRDAFSRITSITDPLNRTANFSYDKHDLLTGATLPIIGTAKYEYDALSNLIKITDPNGAEWKFAYTPWGRLKSQTDPLDQTTNLSYDARGRLHKIAFADGGTTTLTYDAASNLTRSQFSDGPNLKFAYDALNRLVETDGVKFAYNAEGRIVNTNNAGAAYSATYDAAGRVKTVTYADGLTVNYTYDPKTGLLTQVSDSVTKTQIDFTYDKDRRLTNIARSNKVNTALTWDKTGRLTRIVTVGATSSSPIVDAQYTLDAAGQVTGAKITAPLDPTLNLKPETLNQTFDAASQISTTGYRYDARGRLTQSPNYQFAWDGASRLTGIKLAVGGQSSPVTLTYNGLGDVVSRMDGTTDIRYAYNYALGLAPIVAETDGANKPSRFYVWTPSGQLLYAIDAADGNKVSHYHFDRAGSTLALTDASGAVTDAYAYDPFGKLLAHQGKNTQPFTFVGEWGVRQEGTSGALYQMRARYYDAATARFLSREPMWMPVGDARKINPYQYTRGNPISRVDPTGLDDNESDDIPPFAPRDEVVAMMVAATAAGEWQNMSFQERIGALAMIEREWGKDFAMIVVRMAIQQPRPSVAQPVPVILNAQLVETVSLPPPRTGPRVENTLPAISAFPFCSGETQVETPPIGIAVTSATIYEPRLPEPVQPFNLKIVPGGREWRLGHLSAENDPFVRGFSWFFSGPRTSDEDYNLMQRLRQQWRSQ